MSDNLVEQIKKEEDWHRRCLLILVYHTFKQLEFGRSRGGWSIELTAIDIDKSNGYVSEAITLAKHYPTKPEDMSRQKALQAIADRKKSFGF